MPDNLDNSMVLGQPRTWYDGTCDNCRQEFETSTPPQRDDAGAYIERHRTVKCPTCGTRLCGRCRDNDKAFHCEGCRKLHCLGCQVLVKGLPFCAPCGAAWLDELGEGKKAAA